MDLVHEDDHDFPNAKTTAERQKVPPQGDIGAGVYRMARSRQDKTVSHRRRAIGCAGVMALQEDFSRVMSAEQEHQLLTLHADLDLRPADEDLLTYVANRTHAILGAPVLVFGKRDRRWTTLGPSTRRSAGSEPPAHELLPSSLIEGRDSMFESLASSLPTVRVDRGTNGDGPWTLVGCDLHPPIVIAVQGDWSQSIPAFVLLSENITRAHRIQTDAHRARAGLAAHRLSRRLGRARGLREVYEAIVHRMPMAVRARIAALAVPDSDGRLAIVATHGYPRELVEHLRIEPRAGVFGSVFASGKPLLVTGFDQATAPKHRRARYRTDSFVAMPLVSGRDILGVVALTDRRDDRPFTHEDVAMLRALAAPAALALGRELAVVQAENYALTAAIDSLSGAFNRRHFHVRLEEELQRSRRHALSLGFLMIDIDDFKVVNDTYGHLAGDTVIRDVAEILRHSVRVFDVCARFGGEEFAIIMPGSVVESATMVAERIRERIESYRPTEPGLEHLALTVSIGLSVSTPEMTSRDLIASADRALYRAKRAGKNRVRVADETTGADSERDRS